MDQFLESIADAVSQLVLLSETTDEEGASFMLINLGPGAEAVVSATQVLVGIGEEIQAKFVTEEMKSKMAEAIRGIRQASVDIMSAVGALQADQFNKAGRKKLAKAAKIILSSTVLTLQLTDLFECVKLIKHAKKTLNVLKSLVSTTLYSEFTSLAQEFALDSVDLASLVAARVQFILDPVCKRKLEEHNEFVRSQTQNLIQVVHLVFQNPQDPTLLANRKGLTNQFEVAIEEIINAARLSSKTMLEACSLDMRMLDAEGKVSSDIKEFAEDIGLGNILSPDQLEGLDDLRSLLGGILSAAKSGDIQAALSALDQLQEHQASAPPSLARAVLTEEIASAVRALAFEADEMALQSLQELVDFSLMGLEALAPPPSASSAPVTQTATIEKENVTKLVDSIVTVQSGLSNLQSAVGSGQSQAAASAAKETVVGITNASNIGKSIAGDCKGLRPGPQLEKLSEELKSHAPLLVAKTKACLSDPRNQLNKEDFDLAIDKAFETSTQMKTLIERAAKNKGAELIKKQLAETSKEIDDVVAIMLEAAKAGNSSAVADSARQLEQLNKRKTMLVHSLKECAEEDFTMRKQIASEDESLCALIPPLIETAREIAKNPNNTALIDKAKRLISGISDFSAMLDLRGHPQMDPQLLTSLMEGAELIEQDLIALQNAAKSNQTQAIVAAARSLVAHTDQQVKLAATLREQTEDSILSQKVAQDCESLPPLVPPMIAAAKMLIQSPNDPEASQKLQTVVKQGHSANSNVIEAFSKIPTNITEELERLRNVIGVNSSNDEIIEALEPLKSSMSQEAKLARAMAATIAADDSDRQQRLLSAAGDMNDSLENLSGLIQAVIDNPFAVLDEKKVEIYIQKALNAHTAILELGPKSSVAEFLAAHKVQATISSDADTTQDKKPASYDDELLQALEAVSVSEQALPNPTPLVTFSVLEGAARSVVEATTKFQAAQAQVAHVSSSLPRQEQVVGFAKLAKSKYAESDGTLACAAKVVAEQMGRLSSATKISDMISTAKEIANAIGEICALAQAQADLCADPKLRDQLLTAATSIRNHSVQLKILSAVKAASEENELSSAQAQLVTCAKNLADGVVKVLDYSRIAALKKKK